MISDLPRYSQVHFGLQKFNVNEDQIDLQSVKVESASIKNIMNLMRIIYKWKKHHKGQ